MTLLDSNIVIHCLKGREPVTSRLRAEKPSSIGIPSIVACELEYGSLRISDIRRRKKLSAMLGHLREVPFDGAAAREAARIRVEVEERGLVIGPLDLMIAGTVMCRGAILATNNYREFSRIPGLRIEDWTAAN